MTAQGIQPDGDHIAAVLQAPAPTDARKLRSFLGLLSWYNKLISNFATVVEPLRNCIREDTEFCWSEVAQRSFDTVKQLLAHSLALALFNTDLPTIVSTDASDYGLGAILSQIQPNQAEHVTAFASRTLTPAERKYSVVEKEALGCVWAVEQWRTYLCGQKFTLRTDHRALTTLLSTKDADHAGMRIVLWAARLLCFTCDVTYLPGLKNNTVDCLSRLPLPAATEDNVIEPEFLGMLSADRLPAVFTKEFAAAFASYPELCSLREQMADGWPSWLYTLMSNFATNCQYKVILFSVLSDLLFLLLCTIPRLTWSMKGHQGIVKTKQRLCNVHWWPGMDDLVTASCPPNTSSHRRHRCASLACILETAQWRPIPTPAVKNSLQFSKRETGCTY